MRCRFIVRLMLCVMLVPVCLCLLLYCGQRLMMFRRAQHHTRCSETLEGDRDEQNA